MAGRRGLGAVEGMRATVRLQRFARHLVSFLAPYDALLTPALAERPLHSERSTRLCPNRCRRSPARGCSRLVQLVGRPAGEGPLLALAAQLEQALPWAERRPAFAQAVAD